MRLLLILLNIGLAFCLQSPLEYGYEYEGSVLTGIPDIHAQASGFAFRGDMFLQMSADGTAYSTLRNPLRSEFHGEVKCNSETEYPGEFYKTPPEMADKTSVPILAHLFGKNDFVLQVPEGEKLAVSNIRKTIIGSLRNELLNSNFEKTSGIGTVAHRIKQGDIPPTFTVKEETIYGICNVQYTVQKIPEFLAGARDYELKNSMEVDVQRTDDQATSLEYRSKTSKSSKKHSSKSSKKTSKKYSSKTKKGKPAKLRVPQISDDLWQVIRTVDFNNCEESVYLQRTPVGIFERMDGGQHGWLRSRSSVGEYLLRGSGGAFRVERIDLKGTITMNANGAELMQTISRIKLKLHSVSQFSEVLTLPAQTKLVRNWMQEVLSPFEEPKISKSVPWVTYTGKGKSMRLREALLGYEISKEELQNKQKFVVDVIEHFAKVMVDSNGKYNGNPEGTLQKVQHAVTLIKDLQKSQLNEIAEYFMKLKGTAWNPMAKKLVIDLFASSGAPNPTEIVLEYIKEDKITNLQKLTIFMTIFQVQESPLTMPMLMDVILNLDKDNDKVIVSSNALINLASALRHFCISPEAPSVYFMGSLHSDIHCKKLIEGTFFPYLKNKIKGEYELWEKLVAVTALKELQTPLAVPVLISIFSGKYGYDVSLKLAAIKGFRKWNLPLVVRNQAMSFLKEIYWNIGMNPQLRIEALVALATWAPETHLWHTLARSTWKEPSKIVAIFATTLIKAYANLQEGEYVKQSQATSSAIKFARPSAPESLLRKSVLELKQTQDSHSRITSEFGLLGSNSPFESIFGYHRSNYNGFDLEVFKLLIDNVLSSFMMSTPYKNSRYSSGDNISIEKRIAQSFYDKIQETVGAQEFKKKSFRHWSVTLYARAFQHIHLFLSNGYTWREFDKVFRSQIEGVGSIFGKYFQPIEGKLILPTEIGAPSISQITGSISFGTNIGEMKRNVDIYIKLQSQVRASMKVAVGSFGIKVGTSVKSTRQINVPIVYEPHRSSPYGKFEFGFKEQFCPVIAQNTPVTYIGSLFFDERRRKFDEKVIQPFDPHAVTATFSPLRIHHKIFWKSSLPSPISFFKKSSLEEFPWVFEAISSKTAKMWQFEVIVDPQRSQTKTLDIRFLGFKYQFYDHCQKNSISPISGGGQVGQDDFGQYGQETGEFGQQSGGDYEDIEQFGDPIQTISSTFEEETIDKVFAQLGQNDTENLEKLLKFSCDINSLLNQRLKAIGEDGSYIEKTLNVLLPRLLETNSGKQKRFFFKLSKDSSYEDESKYKVCFEYTGSEPRFPPLTTLEEALSSKLKSEGSWALTQDCTGEPIFQIKKEAKMSENYRKLLLNRLQDGSTLPREISPFADLLMNLAEPVRKEFEESNFINDDVRYEISWSDVGQRSKYPIISSVTDGLQYALSFATGSDICTHKDSPGKLSVKFDRCPYLGHWFVRAGKMENPIHIPNSKINYFLDLRNSFGDASNLVDYEPPSKSGKCFISKDKVVSFDQNSFEFRPSKCWTVAAMDCRNRDHWMVLVRESTDSNMPEVRYINKNDGFVVDFGRNIRVNGKILEFFGEKEDIMVPNSHPPDVLATAYKKGSKYLLDVKYNVKIALINKLIIYPDKRYDEDICGLCGNYDYEKELDMVGPHGCLYNDPHLFAAAWTGPSDRCDFYTILGIRGDVENYQKTCLKFEDIKTDYERYSDRGMSFDWLLHKEGGTHACVSQLPVAHCQEGFEPVSKSLTEVEFACYHNDRIPYNVSEAVKSGAKFVNGPIEERPCTTVVQGINLPDACAALPKTLPAPEVLVEHI